MEDKNRTNRVRDFTHIDAYLAFQNLIEYPDATGKIPRGNAYLHDGDQVQYFGFSSRYEVSKHNVRLSRYNALQEQYMDLCRVNLRDAITSPVSGLVARFRKKWNDNPIKAEFERIVCESYMEALNDAFDRNENLIPAFYGFISLGAGADGLRIAVSEALFPRSVQGAKLADNYRAFVSVDLEHINSGKVVSETQCAAPALAMKIISEVRTCMNEGGMDIEEIQPADYPGPTDMLKHQIIDELHSRMVRLGYLSTK